MAVRQYRDVVVGSNYGDVAAGASSGGERLIQLGGCHLPDDVIAKIDLLDWRSPVRQAVTQNPLANVRWVTISPALVHL